MTDSRYNNRTHTTWKSLECQAVSDSMYKYNIPEVQLWITIPL